MENLFWIVTPLIFVFWAIAVAFNAACDVIQYKHKDSVFSLFKEDSWLYRYFQSPEDTWRRKYADGSITKRKTFLGMNIPPMFFDGWHFLKIMRQLSTWFAFIACGLSGTTWVHYKIYPSISDTIYSLEIILASLIPFMMITGGIHELFFKHILLKKSYSKGV